MNDERDDAIRDAIRGAADVPPPPDRAGAYARAMASIDAVPPRRFARPLIALVAAAAIAVPSTIIVRSRAPEQPSFVGPAPGEGVQPTDVPTELPRTSQPRSSDDDGEDRDDDTEGGEDDHADDDDQGEDDDSQGDDDDDEDDDRQGSNGDDDDEGDSASDDDEDNSGSNSDDDGSGSDDGEDDDDSGED